MSTREIFDAHTVTAAQQEYALDRAINGLRDDDPRRSASKPLLGWQKPVLLSLLAFVIVVAVWQPMATAIALIGLCTLAYLLTLGDRVLIFRRGLASRPIVIPDEVARSIPDDELPSYTILVPAYNEPEVVADLIGAMDSLEYPRERLQVLLLLEADDQVTIDAARACGESDVITILLVPPAEPRTKPKACNYGFALRHRGYRHHLRCRGPARNRCSCAGWWPPSGTSPMTWRVFRPNSSYHNGHQNLLTAWFTAEYGLWFGFLLPGMMVSTSPIPLGGTSNHLRREMLQGIGGWDPFNVTEDADLGLRIAASGYRTAVIDSYTLEEANSDPINWIRQRSRWYKGYLQTWLVHIRRPVKLYRTLGLRSFIRFTLVLAGTPIIAVLNLLFWFITLLWFLGQPAVVGEVFPDYIYFPALVAMIIGNFTVMYMNMIALREDDRSDLLVAGLTVALFWLMMSVAAAKGCYQMIRQPSFWEKTFHGLAERPDDSTVHQSTGQP